MKNRGRNRLIRVTGIILSLVIMLTLVVTSNAAYICKTDNCNTGSKQTDSFNNCKLLVSKAFCNTSICFPKIFLPNGINLSQLCNIIFSNNIYGTIPKVTIPEVNTDNNECDPEGTCNEQPNELEETIPDIIPNPTEPTAEQPGTPTQPNANAQDEYEEDTQTQSGITALEQDMVNMVNNERKKAGVAPLAVDVKLTEVARIKSQDMINKNYFSHTSPTYGSPFDMMRSFGITYRTAGENIAMNRSVENAHVALMNSDGHRKNILNSSFTSVGIGIVSDENGYVYITQMFIG